MDSPADENEKLEKLQVLVKQWMLGNRSPYNDPVKELLEFRRVNDSEWVDKEVLCYILKKEVFDLLVWTRTRFVFSTIIESYCDIKSISCSKVQEALQHLINSVDAETQGLDKRSTMCVMIEILQVFKNSFTVQTCERIFHYLMKINKQIIDDELIDSVWRAIRELPFEKYQHILLLLIDSMEGTERLGWRRHENLCIMLLRFQSTCKDLLNLETSEQIFDYLMKLVDRCDHEKTIESACDALQLFSFGEHKPSLLKSLDFSKNCLNLEKFSQNQHYNLSDLIYDALSNCGDLNQETLKEIIEYFFKLTDNYEANEVNNKAFVLLTWFLFVKIDAQNKLKHLISLLENQLNTEQSNRHWKLCKVMWWVFRKCTNLMNPETCEQMFNYLVKLIETCDHEKTIASAWRALEQFPFDKYPSAKLLLIESAISKFTTEQLGWKKHEELCVMIKLFKCSDLSSNNVATFDRFFDYLMKLIKNCTYEETIDCVWSALMEFPFREHQSSLRHLIELMSGQLNSNPCTWAKHEKMCEVLRIVWEKCSNFFNENEYSQVIYKLNQETFDQIFNYLINLIDRWEDSKTTKKALEIISTIESENYETLILELIDARENQLGFGMCRWDQQWKLCVVMHSIFSLNERFLKGKIADRVFVYLQNLFYECEDYGVIGNVIKTLSQYSPDDINSFLLQVCYTLTVELQSSHRNWFIHRNWCWSMNRFLNIVKLNENDMKSILDYILLLFDQCDNMQTTLSNILLVEEMCLNELFDNERKSLFIGIMNRYYLGYRKCPFGNDIPDDFDCTQYEVNWCARWCVDNVLKQNNLISVSSSSQPVHWYALWVVDKMPNKEKPVQKLPLVKLSPDRFEARNDADYTTSIRAPFAITSGVYFYEVTIVTNGEMRFGWGTGEEEFRKWSKIGNGFESICFDTLHKCVWYNNKKYMPLSRIICNPLDVIGCLVDIENENFQFYHNGRKIELNEKIELNFSSSLFYATASICKRQQCHFNFGQVPFKFVPSIQHSNFEQASKDEKKYRLAEISLINLDLWHKHHLTLNFADQTQNEFDELVKNVEEDIRNGQEICEMKNIKIFRNFECFRIIQSIIEVMGNHNEDNNVDVMAMWIGNVIAMYAVKSNKAKLIEFFYPYLQLPLNTAQDFAKHQKICIILVYLIKFSENYVYGFIKSIRSDVLSYLIPVLNQTHDKWTQLFGMIALGNMKLTEPEKRLIRNNKKIDFLCQIDYHQENILNILNSLNTLIVDYQLYVCSQWLNVEQLDSLPVLSNELLWQKTLDSSSQSKNLKLSTDRLSARSDWGWQSVRSTSCDFEYYEALLFTSGRMRIGWSTKQTELDRTIIGNDNFSIALDGNNRCVWHNSKAFPVRNMPCWRAGDILGCRFDKKKGAFYFTLNGKQLIFECSIYITDQPYYVAASFHTHQQCYFLLGQLSFKYNECTDIVPKYQINNSTFKNVVWISDSEASTRDITMNSSREQYSFFQPNIFGKALSKFKEIFPQLKIFPNIFSRTNSIKRLEPSPNNDSESKRIKISNEQRNEKITNFNSNLSIKSFTSMENPSTSKAPDKSTICKLCDKLKVTQLLHFVECDHTEFCRDCVFSLLECTKCNPTGTKQSSTCQLCQKTTDERRLQFTGCTHLKFCRVCVGKINACFHC